MTNIQKAIMADIKAHILEDVANDTKGNQESYFAQFLKGFKFYNMEHMPDYNGDLATKCYPNEKILIRYRVRTFFKAAKYENNVALWQINLYSDGTTSIYFDGTEYYKEETK